MADGRLISEPGPLAELCEELRAAPRVAFDTEFVPEYTFAPVLCLIQVATDRRIVAIDPLSAGELSEFWNSILRPDCELVVHAGKEELHFCKTHAGRWPGRFFDVQLAAGFLGMGHPLSHSNLVQRVLDRECRSTETRTDWRRRPLSDKQVQYALDDVRHLLEIRDRLAEMLDRRGRASWFAEESADLIESVARRDDGERWRRLSGASGLSSRALGVLRELVRWREDRARALDKPPRWILRDDLLTDLAKRQPETMRELHNTRGLENIGESRWAKDLLAAVEKGKNLPEEELPRRIVRRETSDEQMVQKLLSAAMIDLAQGQEVATSLLGNSEDLRELMEWHAGGADPERAPRLARGWRGEVCGRRLTDLLSGRIALRVDNSPAGARLVFETARSPDPSLLE